MDETSYIITTNLTKLRIVDRVLRDCVPDGEFGIPQLDFIAVLNTIGMWTDNMQSRIDEQEDDGKET